MTSLVYRSAFLATIGLLVYFPAASCAQELSRSGKSRDTEKAARELFSIGDYDKAVPLLEVASTEEPNDPVLLSLLGSAYLYSSSRIDSASNFVRAQPTMENAIDHGGEALFFVGLASDRFKEQYVTKAISGELKVGKASLSFTPLRGGSEGTGDIAKGDIKECGLNRKYGKDSNTFHVRTTRTELDFRPLHFSKDEADLVCALVAKYLGARLGK